MRKTGDSGKAKRMRFGFAFDSTASWLLARGKIVAKVGGSDHYAGPGGYIWFGEQDTVGEDGKPQYGRCVGFVGIGKFLRLARAIERRRKAYEAARATSRKARRSRTTKEQG